jgi:putative tricarboxylic transport membrane protein
MRKADLVSAAVVTVFGLLLLLVIIPTWVERHEEGGYGLGARVMPNTMAIIVTALGVLLFASRLVEGRIRRNAVSVEESVPPMSRSNGTFFVMTSLLLIALTALFKWVGFLAAGPLTIAAFMLVMGERRPIPIVLTSVAAAGVIWLFFWRLLDVPLP